MLDQVEGIEDCGARGSLSAQFIEPGQAVGPQHNCLAVDGEALGINPLRRGSDSEQIRRNLTAV